MQQGILTDLLRQNGYSLTQPRLVIFNVLRLHQPLTMKELSNKCKRIDRATVYRTAELFEQLGIANRLTIGWKYKLELSEAFSEHHHHLHCSGCGKTFDVPANPSLEAMIKDISSQRGFLARVHQLEIDGLCENCQKSD
jgi:Fur family ferric uptake transcriptional regulator